jgi:hypothetical protein
LSASESASASPSAVDLLNLNIIGSSAQVNPGHLGDDADSLLIEGDLEVQGTTYIGSASNYTKITSAGIISQAGTARIKWTKITANNITKGNGTHSGTTGDNAGYVADIQTAHDANFYHIDEVTSDPGFELTVEFINVTAFNWINVFGCYNGTLNHPVNLTLYNFNTTTWDCFDAFGPAGCEVSTGGEYTLQNHDFFIPDDTNYIGTGGDAGDVRVKIAHEATGNAAHDLDLGVIALYQ